MAAPEASKATKAASTALTTSFNGAMKAAIWLLSVDESTATAALAHLDDGEVVRLRGAMDKIQKVSPEQLAAIRQEFQTLLENQPLRLRGSIEYLNKLAVKALGESRAALLLNPKQQEGGASGFDNVPVEALASTLEQEHPQVIAAIVATMEPGRASSVVTLLPKDIGEDVVARVARLTKIPHGALQRVEQVLAAWLPQASTSEVTVDGVRLAATMLNQLDAERSDAILGAIAKHAETLASDVRQAMFTFEDLVRLDKRGLQSLLKEVQSDQLLLALKAASEEVRGKIFDSLSKRSAEMLQEDLSLLGPARLADVEAAQNAIVASALQLQASGKITITGQGGGDYV